jgi:predicted nucleotidyltransferase
MDYQTAIKLILTALPDTEAVYVFGSQARNDTHRESDVDLAVLATAPIDALLRFDLQERIASRLHRSVDLVDLRSASTVMRIQVIEHGTVLYDRGAGRRQAFEATALSAYAHLNEERRGIVDDIRQRGRVHG